MEEIYLVFFRVFSKKITEATNLSSVDGTLTKTTCDRLHHQLMPITEWLTKLFVHYQGNNTREYRVSTRSSFMKIRHHTLFARSIHGNFPVKAFRLESTHSFYNNCLY